MNQRGENFELNPISLCMGIPDAKIYEKKMKKKKKNRKKGNSAKNSDGFLDRTQNCSSVGMQNYDDGSKMSNHGSDEVSSDSLVEDFPGSRPSAVLQCSKVELGGLDSNGSVCEDSKIGSGTACALSGKENRNLGWKWQKRQHNARDAQRRLVNEPSYRFGARKVHPVENRVWVAHNSLSGNCDDPSMYGRTPQRVLDESSQSAASPQRLNGSLYRYVSGPRGLGNDDGRLIGRSTNSYWCENRDGKNGLGNCKNRDTARRMFYDGHHVASHGYKHCVNSSSVYSNISTQGVMNGLQPQKFIKSPSTEHNFGRCLYAPLDGKPYSEFRYRIDHKFGRDVTSGAGVKKWKLVGTKEFRPMEGIFSTDTCNALNLDLPVLSNGLSNGHPEGSSVPFSSSDTFSDTKGLNSTSSHQLPLGCYDHPRFHKSTAEIEDQEIERKGFEANGRRSKDTVEFLIGSQVAVEGSSISFPSSDTFSDTKGANSSSHQLPSAYHDHPKFHKSTAEIEDQKIERKGYEANGGRPKNTAELLIGSQMAVEALNASYRLQLASEMVRLAMGCPLAEFERFIHCAAPVIASSYVHKKCSVCLEGQLSHSFLCKHQIPNLSLRTVWNWYERPGNYGLDVKVDDSKNLNGSVSFHAHFVPYLSAVQLFQCQNPGSKTLSSTHSSEAAKMKHLQAGAENFDSVKEPGGSFDVLLHDGLDCSPDFELIFEFFESEQPHQRKPFYNKILELIGVGTSNCHIFGDPSKLDCLNLHDLHPASWFSVAWYPIYRIPEGKLRASFLTYHSLGHFARRPVSVDASNRYISCIFSPVLGLQSCNALGECWFDPKISFGYSSKEPTSSNNAEILKERLRTLEDNALRFARGCICKDKVMVSNRHPDYEFFNSRKPRYK